MNRLWMLERGETLPTKKGCCRLCLEPLPKRVSLDKRKKGALVWARAGFCSDEHRDAYYLATSNEFLRFKVFERDKGVCVDCELDCDALEQRVWGFSTMVKKLRRKQHQQALMNPSEARSQMCGALIEHGFARLTSNHPRTLWEADHDLPLADGGGFGLDNVVTRCQACHIAKTSGEATSRAKRRKLVGKKQTETMRRFKKMGLL